jgi:lipopolysaccharide transport system ATP-binding protein
MYYGSLDLFKNIFGIPYDQGRIRKDEFWALEDISFELRKGETLGIIGVNGAGKSTLLRLISGIFPPDRGKVQINGRVGSLIAVGAGFHPHMTGRENIYLNGTILGMTKTETREKFDSIVDFADIGDFIDAPVSTYSSGMRVRLGFSIAIHCEPDILLVDEVLSVGDLSFRNKCMKYMHNLRQKSRGVIFVSHNLEQIRMICTRVIVMDKGKFVFDGDTEEALIKYYQMADDIRYNAMKKDSEKKAITGQHLSSGDVEVLDIGVLDAEGNKTSEIPAGKDINIYYDFITKKEIKNPRIASAIRDERDFNIIWHVNLDQEIYFRNLKPGKYRLKVVYKDPHLEPDVYRLIFGIQDADTLEYFEKVTLNNNVFKVVGNKVPRGTILCESDWELSSL